MKSKLILFLLCCLMEGLLIGWCTGCSMLAQKGNCFAPPTQAQQDAHAAFTAKLNTP